MSRSPQPAGRTVKAVHGLRRIPRDPPFELALSNYLRANFRESELLAQYARFAIGEDALNALMRRAIWRAMARSFGNGVYIGSGVGFKHIETFSIGDGVFIGAHSFIQGRIHGRCVIGRQAWIGPHSYFDARNLVIENHVGWGPGAKVLGSAHTGLPVHVPIIRTDLVIRRVRICAEADIGTNAVILPGVTVGRGAIVGAGAVVTSNVKPYTIVAGVPARFLRRRKIPGRRG